MVRSKASVPLIVLAGREDDVELVNRSLRDAGHPVRCHWVAKIDLLAGALDDHSPELLCFFPDSLPAPIREVAKIRQQIARSVPLVVGSKAADETEIAAPLLAGAHDPLRVTARDANGGTMPLKLVLEATSYDGEPAVKLSVPREHAERQPEPEELAEHAVHRDPTTGFYHRRRFLELLTDRLDSKAQGGVRALAYIRPDKFREIEERVGPVSSEDMLVQLAEQLRAHAHSHDLYVRFGGKMLTMFI